MNAQEAANKWGRSVKWVRNRCKEGVIPMAEKDGLFWHIPEDAKEPPCTRHEAVTLMRRLIDRESGQDVELYPGKDEEKGRQIFLYLSACGFITTIDEDRFDREIKKVKVANSGYDLIDRVSECKKENNSHVKSVKTNINTPIISAGLEIEREKNTK